MWCHMEPTDLDPVPGERTWDCLVDWARRLDVAIEVLGSNGEPELPVASTPAAIALRQTLMSDQALRTAVAVVTKSASSEATTTNGLHAVCVALPPAGALVVAREASHSSSTDECMDDLNAIGGWLVEAMRGGFPSSSSGISGEAYRLASLRRILDEAAARGSARAVLGAFVEALGVWDDVHGFGYAITLDGGYVRYVAPRDSAANLVPAEIDGRDLPPAGRIVRLNQDGADRLQIPPDAGDKLIGRIRTSDGVDWLLVFRGAIDSGGQVRLALYADILRESLDAALASTYDRLADSIGRRPCLRADEPVDLAAQDLAAQLMGSVDGRHAALAMTMTTGRQVFAVGSTPLLSPHDTDRFTTRLVVTSSAADSLLTFAAARDQPAFTMLERHVARIGVAATHRWFKTVLHRSHEYERRERFRGVDALFEEIAGDAIRAGQHVSLAVVSFGSNVVRPGLLQAGVAKIRDQIRSCDLAAILSATEIAVLLPDVPPTQASVLSARLQQLLTSASGDDPIARPVVGVTTWSPDRERSASIVATARAALAPAV